MKNKTCPNCKILFIESVGDKFRCEKCGWLTEVDGEWIPCDPPLEQEVTPGLEPEGQPDPEPEIKPKAEPKVKSYLGGLLTVTEVDEDDEEENDD